MQFILLIVAFLLLCVAGSLILSIFRGYIPAIPSSFRSRQQMVRLIPHKKNLVIGEIGCGYGFVLFHLAKQFPSAQLIGFEVALLPYLCCYLIQKLGRFKNVRLVYGDAFTYIKKHEMMFDVAVAYLIKTPSVCRSLEELYQYHISSRLILNAYPLEQIPPTRIYRKIDAFQNNLYLYQK